MSQEDGLIVYKNGKWVPVPRPKDGEVTKFKDLMWFYGNIVDYVRVLLCFVAGFTIAWDFPFISGCLIITSHLLDWVDGPVARYFNQCTLFGSGVDWLADVQAQMITAMWWARLSPNSVPWILIATTIELATCIWDFAQTATMKYPTPAPKSGFMKILDWATPGGV
jgi:phosphatidylglycerophosphate synthase